MNVHSYCLTKEAFWETCVPYIVSRLSSSLVLVDIGFISCVGQHSNPMISSHHIFCVSKVGCTCKVLLPISSRVVHKYILHDFGECCESVPLDRPGSYVSISIKIYITIILARVVQVDAFLL